MSRPVCPECGASNVPGAERCDLCGIELAAPVSSAGGEPSTADHASGAAAPRLRGPESADPAAPERSGRGVFCNSCGWHNPPGARFCSQCGAALQQIATATPGVRPVRSPEPSEGRGAAAPKSDASERAAVSRQLAIVVGAAVLLLVALYLITDLSKRRVEPIGPPQNQTAPTQTAELTPSPLAAGQAEQVEALRAEMEALDGEALQAKRRELVELLVGFGRPDHAAVVQEQIAERDGTAVAWTRAGDLYFDWLESLPEPQKVQVAPRVIAAYEQVLADEPDNVDIRAKLGWAYQYDPSNPMQAIQQTNIVLESDPDHIQANFNRGVFLMRINRLDQAIVQFERVKELVGPDSPLHGQANSLIEALRQAQQPE